MEIALLTKSGLRIKGKQATIAIDPQDKATYEAILILSKNPDEVSKQDDTIIITGAGEYEIGGIKVNCFRSESDLVYSIIVDGVEVLVGKLDILEKMQHKLKEHNIVVANCSAQGSASFITSLTENVMMFYGDYAKEIASSLGKENIQEVTKYSSTKDKLPAEVETVVLQ